jgi:RNA polymerase sigma-70 factor (ECF subfamily)
MDPELERSLIERAKKDPEAFGILFEHHYPKMFTYVFRRVEDWNLSKDITSEVFFKAFKGLWRYRWQGIPFSSWLYRIATNELRMCLRKRRHPVVSLDALMEEAGFEPVDPQTVEAERLEAERKLQQHADFLTLHAKIRQLPTKYQDVIALRYFERKTVKEVAEILDLKEGTIKSLLSRGIKKLQKLM